MKRFRPCWRLDTLLAVFVVPGLLVPLACMTFPPEPEWQDQLTVQQGCFAHIMEPWEYLESRELSGVVVSDVSDSQGVPGVAVFARRVPNGEVLREVSDDEGRFRFAEVKSGMYEVAACLDGFNPWRGHVRIRKAARAKPLRLLVTLGA